jgi:hypothetical protein
VADVPSNLEKINTVEISEDSPVTVALMNKFGASVNGLIDAVNLITAKLGDGLLKIQDFTSNGTWIKPDGVSIVFVWGIGGGGGGSVTPSGWTTGSTKRFPGREGFSKFVPVVVTDDVSVTIGQGGVPGLSQNTQGAGGSGGDTVFGDVIFRGGYGGLSSQTATLPDYLINYGSRNGLSKHGEPGWGSTWQSDGVSAASNTGGGGGAGLSSGSFVAGSGGSGRLFVVWIESKI